MNGLFTEDQRAFASLTLVLLLLCLFGVVLFVVGCDEPSAVLAVDNTQVNEITEREKLVVAFSTTDVVGIPSNSHEFLVRDTNGVVWYASTRSGTSGSTRIFGWHEEFPKPVLPPSVTITNWVTNAVTVTNIVLEDTLKK